MRVQDKFRDLWSPLPRHWALKADAFVEASRLIILDEELSQDGIDQLSSIETTDGYRLTISPSLREMCSALDGLMERWHAIAGAEHVLIAYPGNGAQVVRANSKFGQELEHADVPAWRSWTPGSAPYAVAGSIPAKEVIVPEVEIILVVDDVVSSGNTLAALRRNNAWRFPNARWVAAALVVTVPRVRRQSGLVGYDLTLAAWAVRSSSGGRPAINSLSTLKADDNIARSYAERNISYASRGKFLTCLS